MTQAVAMPETRTKVTLVLDPAQRAWAERRVAAGKEASVVEAIEGLIDVAIVCEGFDKTRGETWTPETLRAAIQKGIDSGPSTRVDLDELRRRGTDYLRETAGREDG